MFAIDIVTSSKGDGINKVADSISSSLGPYCRQICKVCTLGYPVLHVLSSLAYFSIEVNAMLIMLGSEVYAIGALVTVAMIASNIMGISLVILEKHPGGSCILLGLYPALQLLVIALNPDRYIVNFNLFCMASTILASLFMLYAENSQDELGNARPLSEVGMNRKAGVITLTARLIYIFSNFYIARIFYHHAEGLALIQVIGVLFLVSMMVCLVIGYRIRALSLVLTVVTFSLSFPSLFDAWDVFEAGGEDYVEATIYLTEFGAKLSAIGGLLRLAVLGGGHYSVDEHLKQL